ncbi:MAG: 5-formyltetrahydrofolate cyclo-ligase [Gammaproteobacteria bacterium]|uniref:5-formyltetrahydrofolate cyclo-ligase n=1 Tax=hydrothermal vent metagenome TaxID=652676 RepID=A0A1W1E3F5_9ZZZZ|nr:5-formyltetrahydrofolate cyclo-ligase [Gammaproteobacteria bacterium]
MQTTRQFLKQQRHAIKACERVHFAQKLLLQVQKISPFRHGQKIALYLENDAEINPQYISNFLEKQGISVYLPIIVGNRLKFAKTGNSFKKNRFGINEPIRTQILNAHQLTVIFMPLVGFDANKNRIGMGGGFYDRTLAFKKHQIKYRHPMLVGLAFDCQKVDTISTQEWDIPLDKVITPTTIYR